MIHKARQVDFVRDSFRFVCRLRNTNELSFLVCQQKAEQEADPSSAVSTTTSSTPLEEDPRLEELALHAVKSKHQMYDLIYDEKFPFDPERDIKFSLVKTKLPLGSTSYLLFSLILWVSICTLLTIIPFLFYSSVSRK